MRKTSRVLFVGTKATLSKIDHYFPSNTFILTNASNAEEMESYLRTSRFDLCLLETSPGEYSAVPMVDQIRKLVRLLPILLLCESPSVESAIELMRHGAADIVINKPENLKELPIHIKAILSKYRMDEQETNLHRIIEIHTISQNSLDPFLALNKQGRIIEWNDHMAQLTQIPSSEALGQLVWDLQHKLISNSSFNPIHYERLRDSTLDLLSKEVIPSLNQGYEFEIIRKDGTSRFVNQTIFPLQHSGEFIVGSLLRDITDKKTAEEAFRASEERYRSLVDMIPDGIVVYSQDRILFANPRALEIGRATSPEDLVGKSIFDFIPTDSNDMTIEGSVQSQSQNAPTIEEKFIALDGTVIDAEVHSQSIIFQGEPANLALIRVITERKIAERKLKESESRLSEAQRLAHLGSFEITTDYRNSYWSDELFRIFNREPGSAEFTFFEFLRGVHPMDRTMINQIFKNTLKKGEPFDADFRMIINPGEVKYLHITGKPILDADGKIEKVFGTLADFTHQKLAEEALRVSEARYHGLFDHAPIVIMEEDFSDVKAYLDKLRTTEKISNFSEWLQANPHITLECLNHLRINDINQAGLSFFHAKSKQELFENIHQVIKEDSLSFLIDELVHLYNGNYEYSGEGVNYTLDGEKRDVAMNWIAASGSDIDLTNTIVTLTDITERNRIITELIRSEARFRAIVEQSLDGIVITNRQGVIHEWNHGMERISGLNRSEVIGKDSWEIQYQQMTEEIREHTTQEEVKHRVQQYLSEKDTLWFGKVIEHPIQRPDGTIRAIQSVFFPIELEKELMVVNISRDVTEIHEARKKLDQTQERVKLISENVSDLLVLFDPDGMISYASPSFLRTLQYDPQELIGINVFSIIHPDDVDLVRTYYYPRLLQGEDIERIDYRARSKDGSFIWLETGAQPIYNARGEIEQVVASSRDVTERKKTEHELQSAQIQLAHRIAELEIRTQELNLLTEMTNMLQICTNPTEAVSVIAQYANDLFPGVSGILYSAVDNEEKMVAGTSWGNYTGEQQIIQKDCWGLRRGRIHTTQDSQSSLYCHHTGFPQPSSSICVPVMASGQAIGLLSLQTMSNLPVLTTAQQKLAAATAEQIGLALSNLILRQNLREMAIRDSLTGLYNRHYLEETLEIELNRAQRSGKPIGLIMLDLDHFKELNSVYGHPNVDQMLREFGAMLKRSVRSGDIACRYGGDEFLLILPETSLTIAQQRAEQIRMQVKALIIQGENLEPRHTTASIGVACWPQHGKTSLRLLNTVDAAMFKAKQSGGDLVILSE